MSLVNSFQLWKIILLFIKFLSIFIYLPFCILRAFTTKMRNSVRNMVCNWANWRQWASRVSEFVIRGGTFNAPSPFYCPYTLCSIKNICIGILLYTHTRGYSLQTQTRNWKPGTGTEKYLFRSAIKPAADC